MAIKETRKELRVEIAHGVGGILLGRAWVDGREVPFVQHESNGIYFIGTADLDATVAEPEPEVPADVAAAASLSDGEIKKRHDAAEKAESEKAKAAEKAEK
jgi:hypothetical protein